MPFSPTFCTRHLRIAVAVDRPWPSGWRVDSVARSAPLKPGRAGRRADIGARIARAVCLECHADPARHDHHAAALSVERQAGRRSVGVQGAGYGDRRRASREPELALAAPTAGERREQSASPAAAGETRVQNATTAGKMPEILAMAGSRESARRIDVARFSHGCLTDVCRRIIPGTADWHH